MEIPIGFFHALEIGTMKLKALNDHCHKRPPVLEHQIVQEECPTFQYTSTGLSPETLCLVRPHMADGAVFH